MAVRARLIVTVESSRNNSTIRIRSTGRYRGLVTNTEVKNLTGLPLYGTASESAFWQAVLPEVESNV